MVETMFEMPLDPAGVPRGRAMIERAQWAARAFASYDAATVQRIVDAAAAAGAEHAEEFARRAVEETGFGVVEHKVLKNVACSTGIAARYRAADYVDVVVDEAAKVVSVPRPAGVVLALTPSTNPVATVYFKILLALLTRNAIVISPHPFAKSVCADAARTMAQAAVAAGAPDGCVQVVDEPSIPLINALMTDPRTSVVLATGGTPMVRSAYHSGNPALGVGPGNVPVLVDATADIAAAARRIVDSKAFDNSILCTNESVLIVEEKVAPALVSALGRSGAHVLSPDERDRVRTLLFPDGHFDTAWVGKPATAIAAAAGVRVGPRTRILVAPFDLVVPEELLAHEKLCPVLGLVTVPTVARGIGAAQAVLRISGQGHSAAIHSNDARAVLEFSTAVRVLRVSVNVGNSLGSAGLETNLAPSMTVGTGFFGRSSLGENLEPRHLVNWTRVAYNAADSERLPDLTAVSPWHTPDGPVPAYPRASNDGGSAPSWPADAVLEGAPDALREEIRRLIIEELNAIVRG
jgi:acyl-CoA reductase-like NAD-dependent aldehyde dehydrogenase